MIIKNGLVWEESGSFRKKELVVDTTTHRIAETAEDDTVFDAEGLYVIPGLVDVHIHGARGHDFSDGNSKGLAEIAQYLHSCGVTSFCPTSMTLPEEQLTAAFATINDVPDAAGYAHIAGIHMEGPYLSPEKKGAQKASYLHAPDAAMFRRLSAASGNKIRIITIAPELPGSDAFIREFKDTVAISLGHSTASYEIAENATVYDVLVQAAKENQLQLDCRGTYVAGISHLYEFDFGNLSGWMYRVNGVFPDVGCGEYQLSDDDRIEWLYTCDLGRDLP